MSKKHGGQGKGHSGKHSGGGFVKHVVNSSPKHHPKHQHKGHHVHHKHHVHVKGKHGHHARGYAIGDLLPVCTFEALAASLRLAGGAVAEDDLLELWWRAGEREVSIAEALDAAVRFGLAGVRPVEAVALRGESGIRLDERQIDLRGGLLGASPRPFREFFVREHALILGVDLPGPHAVLATPDGWWSWGELWSPWTATIEEAWVVSWS